MQLQKYGFLFTSQVLGKILVQKRLSTSQYQKVQM